MKANIESCKPLDCVRFKRLFEKFHDKVLVDVFFMKCPFRQSLNCINPQAKRKGK